MKILVTGAASGLGAAVVHALFEAGNEVVSFDIKHGHDVRDPQGTYGDPPYVDALINCAGVNETAWLEDMTDALWDEVLGVNAKGIVKMTQWLLPVLSTNRGAVLNIVSNASHMPMTCSAAYNASKGAAHILTLQMARELTKRYGITVFGISPNKLRGTEMSRRIEANVVRDRGWTPEYAEQYQRAALLTGEETEPGVLAEFIAFLMSDRTRHKFLTGCILPYGA